METTSAGALSDSASHKLDYFWLALCVLVGFLPRFYLLHRTGAGIESDEAIVGLMAKHILEGRPWPIFYYGQHYMGSLEAILAAGSFSLFGMSGVALKLVPLVFSLLHIVLVYALARRFTGRFGAILASLLVALGPSALILWSTKARGGFIELVVLGSWALLLAVDLLSGRRGGYGSFLLLGLVVGLGWWVNNQMIFYMLPILVVFSLHFTRTLGLLPAAKSAAVALVGFFVGGAPFWYANLFQSPRLATFRTLLGGSAETSSWDHLQGFFQIALPIIFGARRFWSQTDIFPGATLILAVIYAAIFLGVLLLLRSGSTTQRNSRSSLLLLLLFSLTVPVVFSLSSFGWLSQAPRYLLPLYSVLPVFAGIALSLLWNSRLLLAKASTLVGFCLLGGVQIASNYYETVAIPGQPFVFRGERVSKNHDALYEWLKLNRYHHIFANYWIGYRAAFETEERLSFSRYGTPRSLRIPAYERQTSEVLANAPRVLVSGEARLLERTLDKQGYLYRRSEVGKYVVIDHIRPMLSVGEKIELKPEQLSATSRESWLVNLIDESPGTRWGSGSPQAPGMQIQIEFPDPQVIAGLSLDFGFFITDAPRELSIEGQRTDGTWCELYSSRGTKMFYDLKGAEFGDVPRVWNIYFPPEEFQALRLVQHASANVFDWSIAELAVFAQSH